MTSLLDPTDARPLTALEAWREVPNRPGVYAAWITTPAALRALGVAGPAPRLIYIGRAVAASGLRGRLLEHTLSSWQTLNELLAARGGCVFSWWHRTRLARDAPYRPTPSALGDLSSHEALRFQHEHLRWRWISCRSRTRAEALEIELLASNEPLLNHLLADPTPPQLRYHQGFEAARARWLWHMSWTALFVGDNESRNLNNATAERWGLYERWSRRAYQADRLGYPLPLDEHDSTAERLPMPPAREIHEDMSIAAAGAPAEVRHALGVGITDRELETWWAAHVAARFVGGDLRGALTASLNLWDETHAPGPHRLPSTERRADLAKLTLMLRSYRH